MGISACVITFNEERVLARCLASLAFADEIIVVDAHSTDQTLKIAQQYQAKIISEPWRGFTVQRNIALAACQHDWVFFLDADEAASPELAHRLKAIAASNFDQHPNCYSVERTEYFLGKELHFGPGNPSFQWRFFKRKAVRFEGDVHEYPRFDGPIAKITKATIKHWPDLEIEKFLRKLNHYTTLEARDRFALGERTSLCHAFLTFFSTFLKNGIRYRGFLNGKEGVVLVLLEAISRVVRHLKLWLLWQVYEKKINIKLDYALPEPGQKSKPAKADLEKTEIQVKE